MNATDNTSKTERRTRIGFLTEPMGYVEGPNLYEFVESDPTGLVDPLGTTAELPPGVAPPTTRPIIGPISNRIQDIIDKERVDLERSLESAGTSPEEIRRQLAELQRREASYSCTVAVDAVLYVGTKERTVDASVTRAGANGRPQQILVRTTAIYDSFEILASLKCKCPGMDDGKFKWTISVRRGDATTIDLGPWGGGDLPPPKDRTIYAPDPPISITPPDGPIEVP
jgi:hypothetical protein